MNKWRGILKTGFTLARRPDTVPSTRHRVRPARAPAPPRAKRLPDLAPDLVVEVLSPGDRPGEVLAKVADWLSAGTTLVWVVDPECRLAWIHRHDGSEAGVTAEGALEGEDARAIHEPQEARLEAET